MTTIRCSDTSSRLQSGTSVDENLRSRHLDLLFTPKARGRTVLIYVVLEHKSGSDRWTAFQLLRYSVRALDRYLQDHPKARSLPPIAPIVVHHGARAWDSPRTVLEVVDLAGLAPAVQKILAPPQPNLHFLLDDLAAMPEPQIRRRRMSVVVRLTLLLLQFVRSSRSRDPADFVRRWRDLMLAIWLDPAGRPSLLALFSYLAAQLEAPRERLRAAAALIHEDAQTMGKTIADQFREEGFKKAMTIAEQYREEGFKKGVDRGTAQGVAQGVAQGMSAGKAELLLRLVEQRFGPTPAAQKARIGSADPDALDRWADRIFTASSIDELLA